MRFIPTTVVSVLVCGAGCLSERSLEKTAVGKEHAIVHTLGMRDRNAVHVALWTLQQNGITNFQAVGFDVPYSEVRPRIQAVCELLKALPKERLSALDQSLAYHWQIYSPIWISHGWP